MELEEMKTLWQTGNLETSIKINRQNMHTKLQSSLDKVRINELLRLLLWAIVTPSVLVMIASRIKNDGTLQFYLGLIAFFVPLIFLFVLNVYNYICLLKIDISKPMILIQKELVRMELLKRKLNQWGYAFVPVVLWGMFVIYGLSFFKKESYIFLLLVVLFALIGGFVKFKVVLPREFKNIKAQLDEIEAAEKVHLENE